jgi:uncharacterized membrane protein YfcA
MHWEYTLLGLLAGVLVGLTGVGGGSLVTPVLTLFGIPTVSAVGTDLVFAAITKTCGTVVHRAQRSVDWRIAGLLAAGSCPGAALSVLLLASRRVPVDGVIEGTLAVALILTGISLCLERERVARLARRAARLRPLRPALTVAAGADGTDGSAPAVPVLPSAPPVEAVRVSASPPAASSAAAARARARRWGRVRSSCSLGSDRSGMRGVSRQGAPDALPDDRTDPERVRSAGSGSVHRGVDDLSPGSPRVVAMCT